MGSRIMPDGKLGRYQYLEDPNWVPEAYIIDYETHKRYYPKQGMDAIVELLNFQDNKITELKRDYGLGEETKQYSRQLEADNKRIKIENTKLKRITDNHINIIAEVDALISFYKSKITEYQKIYPTCNAGCLIKEYKYKIQALKELRSRINEGD